MKLEELNLRGSIDFLNCLQFNNTTRNKELIEGIYDSCRWYSVRYLAGEALGAPDLESRLDAWIEELKTQALQIIPFNKEYVDIEDNSMKIGDFETYDLNKIKETIFDISHLIELTDRKEAREILTKIAGRSSPFVYGDNFCVNYFGEYASFGAPDEIIRTASIN